MSFYPQRPVSKLSILFILSIILPGLILSYFSIQNIRNQRKLTEKRVFEEQKYVAGQIAEKFQQEINGCASQYFQLFEESNLNLEKVDIYRDSTYYIPRAFILNFQGQFIIPHYVDAHELRHNSRKSVQFTNVINQAEQTEFSENSLFNASKFYQQAFKMANTPVEKAMAINAKARVYQKRNLIKQAYQEYHELIMQCGDVFDEAGFPYAYYAIHQLIKSNSSIKPAQLLSDITDILDKIISGKIPLTRHINAVLPEIIDWHNQGNFESSESIDVLTEKITECRGYLSFCEMGASVISEYFDQHNFSSSLQESVPLETIMWEEEGQPILLLLKRYDKIQSYMGIQIALENVRTKVLADFRAISTEFAFKTDIISRNYLNNTSIPSTTVHELYAEIPMWQIVISLADPETVNRFINRQRWIYGISLILLMAGMLLGIGLVLRDISREQRLARLRADFISNVTHELKTPLTSIRMFAETMKLGRTGKKKQQHEYLSVIVNETERLTRLVNTVLDFSKIEQDEKQYEKSPVDLSQIVKSAIRAMEFSLKEQGFKLNQNIAENVKMVADGDAIEQAVLNLLSNSMKYSKEKKEIKVDLWQDKGSIYIRIEDKGLGIPEAEQKKIFEKYYRVSSRKIRGTAGAGLGLTVVKHIVDAHGGRIELESKEGKGSTFTLIIPERWSDGAKENSKI